MRAEPSGAGLIRALEQNGQLVGLEEALRPSTIPFLVEVRDWARPPVSFHREFERDYVVLVERRTTGLNSTAA